MITAATEITRTGYCYKYTCSDRSIVLFITRDAFHELFCVFGDFFAPGTQDAEVTKSPHIVARKLKLVSPDLTLHPDLQDALRGRTLHTLLCYQDVFYQLISIIIHYK